ncbi:hypothetical protein SNEBB_007411 [Seison nebaliae]|nr:hypothetical protein SNEBB_007411 [Seison nebaliae]
MGNELNENILELLESTPIDLFDEKNENGTDFASESDYSKNQLVTIEQPITSLKRSMVTQCLQEGNEKYKKISRIDLEDEESKNFEKFLKEPKDKLKLEKVKVEKKKILKDEKNKNENYLTNEEIEENLNLLKNHQELWKKLIGIRVQFQKILNFVNSNYSKSFHSISDNCKNDLESITLDLLGIIENNLKIEKNQNFIDYRNEILDDWFDRSRQIYKKRLNTEAPQIKTSEQLANFFHKMPELVESHQELKEDVPKGSENNDGIYERNGKFFSHNIFDDSDFYHDMLKMFIMETNRRDESMIHMYGMMNQPNKELKENRAKEFDLIRSQLHKKITSKKMGIDTKKSKERRVKYETHDKLVNFVSDLYKSKRSNEFRNSIYSSLFRSESVSSSYTADDENEEKKIDRDWEGIESGKFRFF